MSIDRVTRQRGIENPTTIAHHYRGDRVVCDNIRINFPVPYLNHYEVWGINLQKQKSPDFWKGRFTEYRDNGKVDPNPFHKTICPYEACGAEFELHSTIKKRGSIVCPTCLQGVEYPNGFPPDILKALFEALST